MEQDPTDGARREGPLELRGEIRATIDGIIGTSELLLETNLTTEQRDHAKSMRKSAESLLVTINDILDLNKVETGKLTLEPREFDPRLVMEEVADLLAKKGTARGIELGSLVHADVPERLTGDPGRLRQTLLNLAGTVLESAEMGAVTIRAALTESTTDESVLRFEVIDTGIGVTSEQRTALLESFSEAEPSSTGPSVGTDLGLGISKQVVELMGGKHGVDIQQGGSTTFWFTGRFAPGEESQPLKRADEITGLRLLIVDDNETNRDILSHQVRDWGVVPSTAEDALSAMRAMKAAAAKGEPFQAAILDMQMPDMDGLTLAERISSDPNLGSTKLVLLTSAEQVRGDARRATDAGISAYLSKPVRESHLYDCLAILMAPEEKGAHGPDDLVTRHTIKEARSDTLPRVLIVEDNVVNQRVAVGVLKKLGYRSDVAADADEAIQALSKVYYAAVLMDCHLPQMDGYEATAEIRRREQGKRHTPIIAMTSAMENAKERCLAAGMDDFVTKPVRLHEIGSTLQSWVPAPS